MHQYLFHIGDFPVRMYGLVLCMSIFLATVLLAILDMLCWVYIYYSMGRNLRTLNEINPLMNLG